MSSTLRPHFLFASRRPKFSSFFVSFGHEFPKCCQSRPIVLYVTVNPNVPGPVDCRTAAPINKSHFARFRIPRETIWPDDSGPGKRDFGAGRAVCTGLHRRPAVHLIGNVFQRCGQAENSLSDGRVRRRPEKRGKLNCGTQDTNLNKELGTLINTLTPTGRPYSSLLNTSRRPIATKLPNS